jgi:hypothetical protein
MNIRTAIVWPNGKAYFFACGNQYIRYDMAKDIADQFPKPINDTNWTGLATAFPNGVDAAIAWNNGKAYFFKGDQYVAYNMDPAKKGVLSGFPRAINAVDTKGKEFWPGLKKAGFDSNIDAVIPWNNGKAYFFKGNQYLAYNMDPAQEGVLPGFPRAINAVDTKGREFWPGLKKAGFDSGLDAAVAWNNGKAYFFKGDQYVAYSMDPAEEGVLPEYPRPISGNWAGLECDLPNPPLWMKLTHVRCFGETSDGSPSDEIYVVMFSAAVGGGLLPAGIATMTPLMEDFDDTDKPRLDGTTNWGLNGSPGPIASPNDVIFLAGMMENDSSEPEAVRLAVGTFLIAQLASYTSAGLSRSAMVSNLKTDMFAAEGLGALSGTLKADERIGTCLEIPVTEAHLIAARVGRIAKTELEFIGDGGLYRVRWQMGRAGTSPNLSPEW